MVATKGAEMKLLCCALPADLCGLLRDRGHLIDSAQDGDDAISVLGHGGRDGHQLYDLLLAYLDGEAVGTSFPRRLRLAKVSTPLIVVGDSSACRQARLLRAVLLEGGADDFLLLPPHERELQASIDACVRRAQQRPANVRQVGPLLVDFTRREVWLDGGQVQLSRKMYEVLEVLAMHAESPVTTEAIMAHLYESVDDAPESKIVGIWIFKLRRALDSLQQGSSRHLWTLWRSRYMLSEKPCPQRSFPAAG